MSDSLHILFLSRTPPPKDVLATWAKFAPPHCQMKALHTQGVTTEWLTQHVPAGAVAIVLADNDVAWRESTVAVLRTSAFRFLPLVRYFSKGEVVDEASLSGFDDFLLAAEAGPGAFRMAIRVREGRQRAEADKAFKDQLAQIAKADTALKQREEFLGVCAHDLRSPLGLIQSSLALILNSKPAMQDFHLELITRAKRQATQAIGLVNDLLDVMSYEQGLKPDYQLVDLHSLLADFHRDYSFQAEQKQVKVHYENPIQNWRVLADGDRIRQLLQNLFTNALKFTESGKNIYIEVSAFQGRRKTDPEYPMVVIGIKDEGRGIPEAEMQKIFDRFTQIKSHARADGRGLGLTVAKQISTLHDGNIWVESKEGKGSTFFVLFPHVVSRFEAPAPPPQANKTILVAEPVAARQKEVFGVLSEWGYDVIFARDGIEALTLLFHRWPSMLILTPELAKVSATEVANLLKADALGCQVPLMFAGTSKIQVLADAELPIPFTRDQWNQSLKALEQRLALPKAA